MGVKLRQNEPCFHPCVFFPVLSNTQGSLVLQAARRVMASGQQAPAFLSRLICIRLPLCLQSNRILWKPGILSSGMAALIRQSIRLIVFELQGPESSLATGDTYFCLVGPCASSIFHRGWVFSCQVPSAQEQLWQRGGGRHHGWIFPAFVLFPRTRQRYQQQGELFGELLFWSGK